MLDKTDIQLLTAPRNGRPASPQPGSMPTFSWAELEEALASIAASPRQRDMTPDLVSATRKQAAFMPRSQVLREVLCLAWVIADETFTESPDRS